MAKITIEYASEVLAKNVTLSVLVPESLDQRKIFPTLYLLHGLSGHHSDWTNHTRIQRWANEHQIAVVMPSADNKFYIDNPKTYEYYGRFIGEELVTFTRNMFPLSSLREDTSIGGLSMGGYGALVNGFKYYETFGTIVALSSALIIDEIPHKTGDINSPILENRVFFETVFGDLSCLIGSDKDYNALLSQIPEHAIPRLYLSCGEDDFFIKNNRDYHAHLDQLQIPNTYVEIPGNHDWDTWDTMIHAVLNWL